LRCLSCDASGKVATRLSAGRRIASELQMPLSWKQALLELTDPAERLDEVFSLFAERFELIGRRNDG